MVWFLSHERRADRTWDIGVLVSLTNFSLYICTGLPFSSDSKVVRSYACTNMLCTCSTW